MKIQCKDFDIEKRMLGLACGSVQTAIDTADRWLESSGVKVINVETLRAEGFAEVAIRVWFQPD